MDERRVADYFVVAGLPEELEPVDDFSKDGTYLKPTYNQAPITDITVIIPSAEEIVPPGYTVIESTPQGYLADLNYGSLQSPEIFLCYKRGRDKPPLVDIGVMYDGKERILPDSEIILKTPKGLSANINNSSRQKTYLTYRRAPPTMPCNALVVTDIVVIMTNKGEDPPHAFCMINKNLNRGLVGSDIFLCYKKSVNRANVISYKPGILSRYPHYDRQNFPFPTSVPLFCLPMGATLECWPVTAKQPEPVFSTFVLTVSDAAQKVYGSAITFYERYPRDKVTPEQKRELDPGEGGGGKDVTYHTNKCICLLSHWPFFDTFEKFLLFLYNMACEGPHTVPIERYISHFLEEVPFPSIQRPRILVQLSPEYRLILTQPEDLPLPRSGAGFRQLLINLGPENCLQVLLYALTEQKVLIHSLRPDVLTAVAEAVSMIIFPFKWQCPYIPLCPLGLAEVLHAPLPFLIGVDSRFFDLYDPPTDVNCVDLDTNYITVCENIKYIVTLKLLPKKPARTLRNSLERLYQKLHLLLQSMQSSAQNNDKADENSIDQDFQLRRKEQSLELEIQEAFLRFMASILKGYRSFLLPIIKAPTVGTTDTNSLFDLQGFLRSRDRAHHKFFSLIVRTQMFIRFIEERSFVSDMDAGLAFFDECTEKVDGENGDVHLIELDESHHSERTVFIMPPEPTGLPSGELYTYEGFSLNPLLFSHKELKNLLTIAGGPRLSGSGIAPGSPMARRTKHEIKSAQKLARKYASSPELWAKCLLGTCFSIWFIHLPSFALMSHNKAPATLRIAYELLVRIQKAGFVLRDEVCYRVMMQLCGVYSQPVLAVKLLFHMKRSGLQPNAITYGFYNRAVLEAAWPSDMNNSSQLLWNKLRNVVLGAALFRQAGSRLAKHRRLSTVTDDGMPAAGDTSVDGISHTSADSSNSHDLNMPKSNAVMAQSGMNNANSMDFAAFDRFRSRVGSIVRPTGLPLLSPSAALKQHSFESSAGLLMPGVGATLKEENSDLFDSDHIDSLVGSSPPAVPPPKRRGRSGSCSEFVFSPTQVAPRPQLKHAPTSPKPGNHDADCFKLLTRSESFANDAGILAKLSLLKLEMQPSSSDSTGSLTGSGQMNGRNKNQSGLKSLGQTCSKALFRRRGSLNLKRLKENTASESYESSTENLGGSSTGGSCEGGSIDDLEAGINNSGLKRNRILSALGSKVNKIGGEVWTSRRNSVDSATRMKTSKSSNESLCKSPIKSPSRTPVTENDPLGALMNDVEHTEKQTQKEYETVSRLSSEIELDHSGAPVLFDRRKGEWGVVRSATFHQRGDEDSDEEEEEEDDESSEVRSGGSSRKSMQRSSTMPIDGTDNTAGQGTLGSLGSTFKLPFTRYSPARFSLRKADLRIGTQLIENAITNFSPSSLTSKKSNEILMGGLHSLKSAATSVAKKFDEIKEAISANSTPIKTGSMHSVDQDDCLLQPDAVENSTVDATYPRRKVSSEFSPLAVSHHIDMWSSNLLDLFGDGSRKGSASNLQPLGEQHSSWASQPYLLAEKLYPKMSRDPRIAVALEITMTTCSKCHNCASVLYDEEIMAGWVPDDSNLNTKCIFCDKATVPFLCVSVLDYRSCSVLVVKSSVESLDRKSSSLLGASNSSVNSNSGVGTEEEPVACEPITVPYLNPLVLRKELESILYAEGDSCLTEPKFVDEHPIIYWNMVWVFQRISVTSHLPSLCLRAVSVLNQRQESSFHPSWAKADHNNILIRCMWDNPRLHEEVGQPMYVLWNQDEQQSSLISALLTDRTTVSRGVMESVINSVRCNDLVEPLKKLATERHKLKGRGVNRSHSLYRDILYLAFGVLGRDNIDQSAFDREYVTAYYTIPEQDSKMYLRCDRPPSQASLFCRSCFRELEL